ncbi:MAG: 50S ribosomal protein L9 [Candidatus Eisenbacteria bacterium]|uniref:Large ribosomal subunit protein bL9 n=1 Tax=Eiseniibacteriota bacterium TaxID=2212470 RepID=A0A937XAV6_UNCEI|nr:50S ribosomal protein L9 [Candidatus Eisenbacteria bacterium]
MEIILLEDVEGLGRRGERRSVAPGYARNHLLPGKLAIPATSAGARLFEQAERVRAARGEKERRDAQGLARRLEKISLTIPAQVGEDDRLFGSVTSQDIVEALQEQGLTVERRRVQLEEPLKVLGVYKIDIRLHADIVVPIRIWVTKQQP